MHLYGKFGKLFAVYAAGAASCVLAGDLSFAPVSGPAWGCSKGVAVESAAGKTTVQLASAEGVWNAESGLWLRLEVSNRGKAPVLVKAGVRSQGCPEWAFSRGAAVVPPGGTRDVPVLIWRKIPEKDSARLKSVLGDLRSFPGIYQALAWQLIDASRMNSLTVEFYPESGPVDCRLSRLYTKGSFELLTEKCLRTDYLPSMDRFGQAKNGQWDGKIVSEKELPERLREENLTPNPANRDQYGGWTGGPKLKATGHFYTTKRDGKWWLVDPDGNPFWSLGIAGINYDLGWTHTPGIPREKWNPYQENLARKYGSEWKGEHILQVHRRLHSWGFNTLGNWTGAEFYELHRTPYTVAIHYPRAVLSGHEKMWGDELPDVFHPEFKKRTIRRLREETETAADPWCIGYFIDNELAFQSANRPAELTLNAPPGVPTREEFLQRLRKKYNNLKALNEAWRTAFDSWDAVRRPDRNGSREYAADLNEFSWYYYHTYYRICRDAVREAAPDKLYLGSRIPFLKNQTALSICAEYADVVSVNLYDYTPDVLELPPDFDAPIMIGEFHFGTPGVHGYWGGGLVNAESMKHAAELFKWYVASAAKHPQIVGAHWFQFHDQPLSGRLADGENHRIGFVDITDTPYPEMVSAARDAAEKIYLLRQNFEETGRQ